VRAIGPASGNLFARQVDGTCAAATPATGLEYHSVGAPLPDQQFYAFERVPDAPGPGLSQRRLVGPGGRQVVADWYEGGLRDVCYAAQFGDKIRCAPALYPTGDRYADARCTQRLWYGGASICPSSYTFDRDGETCPIRYVLYKVGDPYTGQVYQRVTETNPQGCVPLATDPRFVYRSLTAVPESTFPELTPVVGG
jgi:hypothetical protein